MAEFRIQPQDIEIPKGDPFKYDLLNRKEMAETLTQLVGSIQGACVLVVDAPWGAGKTTFLRMWSQYLREEGFPVIDFNAWESDFSEDPFMALCTRITTDLRAGEGFIGLSDKIFDMENAAQMALELIVTAISYKTGGAVNVGGLMRKVMLRQTGSPRFAKYRKAVEAVKKFEEKLEVLADTLVRKKERGPFVVMIDELDRCRPSYAVEFLETAKHLFAVDKNYLRAGGESRTVGTCCQGTIR